ncbi:MAG: helix-turn-helix domain-containing protein, partial [Actinomycetota bacterium]|nr:helix-turn-helix domain-containing protein [Actinomycetota bacterium]
MAADQFSVADYLPEPAPRGRMGAREHLEALHRDTRARVTLVIGKNWRKSRHYGIQELKDAAPYLRGVRDVYISQNSFWGRRRVVNLARLGAIWADLDYYTIPHLAGRIPREQHPPGYQSYVDRHGPEPPDARYVLDLALAQLERGYVFAGERRPLPYPSFAVSTGRGLALVWLHTAVPRPALPRWRSMQMVLHGALKSLGADRQATDAARVLRLAETKHGGTGRMVEVIAGSGSEVWCFEDLAREVLPFTREEVAEYRSLAQARAKKKARGKEGAGDRDRALDLTAGTLHEARLEDLQRLSDLRLFERFQEGARDKFMFPAAVSLSWLVPPKQLGREVVELARRATTWEDRETRSAMGAVISRARQAAKGRKVEWRGRLVDTRYRLTNAYIIDSLGITEEEQRHMRTLIGPEEKTRRHREAERARKHAAGEVRMSREEYLEGAVRWRAEAFEMSSEGLRSGEIARRLGKSKSSVQKALRAAREEGGGKS